MFLTENVPVSLFDKTLTKTMFSVENMVLAGLRIQPPPQYLMEEALLFTVMINLLN
jgi:hypothetical protein